MNLHEYQSKNLFSLYGIPVPENYVLNSVVQADDAIAKLGTNELVVKAQVHAGGRGKAGGVKLVSSKDELIAGIEALLGTKLVTHQTDASGQPINSILIETKTKIKTELYLSIVIDRASKSISIVTSTEGGVNIEEVAESDPEKIISVNLSLNEVLPFRAREIGFKLGLSTDLIKQFTPLLQNLVKLFIEKDLSLLEINPLVITEDEKLICLDAKINIDDNALYRQDSLEAMRDPSQEDERETLAKNDDLSYISLDGNIGCMVNGAGLAMATMDLIKLCGGEPANFLDVGGGADQRRVTVAFKIILSDPNVKAILVNIFGGIVRCDLIAEGIIAAVNDINVSVPVVVRLEGNKAEEAKELLNNCGLNIISATSLEEAANKVVAEGR